MYTHILKTAHHIVRAEFKTALRLEMEKKNGRNDDEIIEVKLEVLRSGEPKVTWETSWNPGENSSRKVSVGESSSDNKGLNDMHRAIAQVVRNRLVVALNKNMHSKLLRSLKSHLNKYSINTPY